MKKWFTGKGPNWVQFIITCSGYKKRKMGIASIQDGKANEPDMLPIRPEALLIIERKIKFIFRFKI
jgi:hypothetical protein